MRISTIFFYLSIFIIFFVVDSSAQLEKQWVARYTSALKGGKSLAVAMAVDDSEDVLVTGWITTVGSGLDYLTIKYKADGTMLWAKTYGTATTGDDKATAVTFDTAENVYVTGTSDGGPTGLDYATVKYDKNGNQLWVARYDGANGEDQAVSIAVNDSLNVFVTGKSTGSGTNFDYATVKYNSLGAQKWAKRYNGPGNGIDYPTRLILSSNTELYITGASTGTSLDYFTIRYNPITGDSIWGARYDGPKQGIDIARGLARNSASEVYVTGGSEDSINGFDYATIKYNSTGVEQWVERYNGDANGNDIAYTVGISGSRPYVTGTSANIGSYNDIVTVRYSSGGGQNWANIFDGPANDDDFAASIVAGGTTYVVGATTGNGTGYDYTLISINSSGNTNWSVRYNGNSSSDDVPYKVLTKNNSVYVTGGSTSIAPYTDALTIKYSDPSKLRYRTITQDSLKLKPLSLKKGGAPNTGNVRDSIFFRAYPKIKAGLPNAPGGLVLGKVRKDSAAAFGWIRIDKGAALLVFTPQTGQARGFDLFAGASFVGEKKDPKLASYNNHLLGELIALRLNISASDYGITPPTFGDIIYNDNDTANHYNGKTLRQLASFVDNLLTYAKRYPSTIAWSTLDSMLSRVNRAFVSPLTSVSVSPLVITGGVLIDSVSFLQPPAKIAQPAEFYSDQLSELPNQYELFQNYPNPFNPSTKIQFNLSKTSFASIKIFDVLGQEVTTLVGNELLEQGAHEIEFNAGSFASGIYFYRLIINNGEYQQVKKMVLLK